MLRWGAVAAKQSKKVSVDPAQKYMVPVVKSTFRILEELSATGTLGLNELTQRTGIPKSTIFRILTTLHSLGYVMRNAKREYCVSPGIVDLASDQAQTEVLRRAALPWMVKLRNSSGETVNLGQLQFDKVIYLEVVPSEFALRLSERPGATVATHASALGKAILAFSPGELVDSIIRAHELSAFTRNTITEPGAMVDELRRVRERGYAFDKGEASSLATCVGAPIVGETGRAFAAMSISGPTSRFNPRRTSPIIEELLRATAEISRELRKRQARAT
jgi:IclR family transcriptional regulator, acetate operon repressor